MTSQRLNVHYGQYLALLQTFNADVTGVAVFDRDGALEWRDVSEGMDEKKLAAPIFDFMRADKLSCLRQVSDDEACELVKLRDENDELVLIVCVVRANGGTGEPLPLADEATFIQLNEFLLSDYCQNVELAAKEDELVTMTEELTRRYEELNLVYKAEDQEVNVYHGRELLQQLVLNTARFLNVDIIYLYIAGKNIAMHKFRDDMPLFQAESLFRNLREVVFPQMEREMSSLVVNHEEQRGRLGIDTRLPFKFVASPIVNTDGVSIGLLATASQESSGEDYSNSDRNLLEVMSKKASKVAQSHFDPLTGLENSYSFELILRDLLRQSREPGSQHAIANVDIDRLTVINDISGREAGDTLIKLVSRKLANSVRPGDLVARIGSDKFGILLKNCDLTTAAAVMKRASYGVSSLDLEWKGKRHEASISVGIASIGAQARSVTSLLDAAETARNVSKQRGRNNIHVLEPEDENLRRRKEQIQWVARIQEGLRDNRFQLYAQLIEPIRAHSNRQHYEILLRLQQEDGAIIEPGEFLPAAESFYLMVNLDLWVINQTFRELKQMQLDGKRSPSQVSINLSGQSLNDPITLAGYIENKLEEYELDGQLICFEITESEAIANLAEAAIFIEQIRNLGCKFSLDDFGTGLSSFSYLKNLHVDYLKIDGSFVRDIVRDPVSESMVAAINQVGQAMQLQTVAEYVENDDIKKVLNHIGVNYGQGFGIGKPGLFRDIPTDLAESA